MPLEEHTSEVNGRHHNCWFLRTEMQIKFCGVFSRLKHQYLINPITEFRYSCVHSRLVWLSATDTWKRDFEYGYSFKYNRNRDKSYPKKLFRPAGISCLFAESPWDLKTNFNEYINKGIERSSLTSRITFTRIARS